jgi:hypothetical protein
LFVAVVQLKKVQMFDAVVEAKETILVLLFCGGDSNSDFPVNCENNCAPKEHWRIL